MIGVEGTHIDADNAIGKLQSMLILVMFLIHNFNFLYPSSPLAVRLLVKMNPPMVQVMVITFVRKTFRLQNACPRLNTQALI